MRQVGRCHSTGRRQARVESQIGQVPYSSAKAGIVAITRVAARDFAQRHIRVSTIALGIFDTPLLANAPIGKGLTPWLCTTTLTASLA
ncbi:MAG: hypothetical protein CK528_06280 [Alcaligenaceae bacterium]|nr:MAG: hypothetical protein CK528_06280 [Alcaligenaceae bacterium]